MVMGRPPGSADMDKVVATVDGVDVTAEQRIIGILSVGGYVEVAAAAAGINKTTVYDWLRRGARAIAAEARGQEMSRAEIRYAAFANSVARAEAQGMANLLQLSEQIARGGNKTTDEVVEYDADGNVLKRTVRTITQPPNGSMISWRLERRWPELYGRQRIEVTGADGSPLRTFEERVEELAVEALAFLEDQETKQSAIEAQSSVMEPMSPTLTPKADPD